MLDLERISRVARDRRDHCCPREERTSVMKPHLSRRAWLASAAAAPLAFDTPLRAATPGPPPYTLSINIEVMFPRTMPRPQRMEIVAAQGFKAYGFWNTTEEEQDAMLKVQEKT